MAPIDDLLSELEADCNAEQVLRLERLCAEIAEMSHEEALRG